MNATIDHPVNTHADRLDGALSRFVALTGVEEALVADEGGLCVATSGAMPDHDLLAALTAHASLMIERVRQTERFSTPIALAVTLAGGSVLHVHPFHVADDTFVLATTGRRPALDELHRLLAELRDLL
ncbi:MAG: hypothetical protein CSA66_02905 [Proteobacteria bacterium]|nr:MAG: hypothetical protein CSA66_02905 [Pseudomonadota bacterium]